MISKPRGALALLILLTIPLALWGEGCGGGAPARVIDASPDAELGCPRERSQPGCSSPNDLRRFSCTDDGRDVIQCASFESRSCYWYAWTLRECCPDGCANGACRSRRDAGPDGPYPGRSCPAMDCDRLSCASDGHAVVRCVPFLAGIEVAGERCPPNYSSYYGYVWALRECCPNGCANAACQ